MFPRKMFNHFRAAESRSAAVLANGRSSVESAWAAAPFVLAAAPLSSGVEAGVD